MDFGDFPALRYPAAAVSANFIVYRHGSFPLSILTGTRGCDPWRGARTLAYGGFVDPGDEDVITAAKREVAEETGLAINCDFLVGIYGPERYRWVIDKSPAKPTMLQEPADVRPVVCLVFAGHRVGGDLRDSEEESGLRWTKPSELAGVACAFDHARWLADFLHAFGGKQARFSAKSVR
jgi:ADP-ribose pyrophosphatase YjhB (NUDIX family)